MIYVVYIKSSEIELVFATLNKEEAANIASMWGKHSTIIKVLKPKDKE